MATPKKRIVALTVGVWLANAGSAAALTYELNRPLSEHRLSAITVGDSSVETLTPIARDVEPSVSPVLYLPPTKIIGQSPRHVEVARNAHKAARDISVMHCADWRDLDMGSGHVQVCD